MRNAPQLEFEPHPAAPHPPPRRIADTHVLHHLFSTIPHYHAVVSAWPPVPRSEHIQHCVWQRRGARSHSMCPCESAQRSQYISLAQAHGELCGPSAHCIAALSTHQNDGAAHLEELFQFPAMFLPSGSCVSVQEATEAIKPILGDYYLYDDRFLLKVGFA